MDKGLVLMGSSATFDEPPQIHRTLISIDCHIITGGFNTMIKKG
jgi:hypothetical protein